MGEPDGDDSCEMCGDYNNRFVICDECLAKILETVLSKEAAQALVKEKVGEYLYADYFTGKPENLEGVKEDV